jgi:hypothetical protein
MDLYSTDKVYFSVTFTWDLPALFEQVRLAKEKCQVEIGGPAATAMPELIEKETGIKPHIGLDDRFENLPGKYGATVTSRGCPRSCEFCLVPKLEGRKMVTYKDFPIPVGGFTGAGNNPYVLDNNILATPWDHQEYVVERLRHVKNLDMNSGFDCRIFVKKLDEIYQLYDKLKLECWRMAYDKEEEREPVKICAEYLQGKKVDYRHIIVFCLVGGPGQTFDVCRERLQYLVDIGCSPYPMRYRPFELMNKTFVPEGWEEGQIEMLFNYYGVPWRWRSLGWKDFRKSYAIESADAPQFPTHMKQGEFSLQ